MKYTIIPLILHVPENVEIESVILDIKHFADNHHKSYVAVCEVSEWKESDKHIFVTPSLTKLPKSERQF
jgi:hypothetical protein